jgi:hypothetical protein
MTPASLPEMKNPPWPSGSKFSRPPRPATSVVDCQPVAHDVAAEPVAEVAAVSPATDTAGAQIDRSHLFRHAREVIRTDMPHNISCYARAPACGTPCLPAFLVNCR